ncbi:MAG: AmmeMemoRadiSam system protein A [Deferrisomatales bacterium]
MPALSPDARRQLLAIAREAIALGLEGRRHAPAPPDDPALAKPSGAFVTLHRAGALRGCVGLLAADRPLYRTVAEMARSAAFGDSRFPAVDADEFDGVEIDISVLGPLRRIADPAEVEVGRHGLYVVRGAHRGVLLPQVATEQGWNRERFLDETCRKAGLPRDAWRTGAELYVFEAQVFAEG